MKQLMVQFAKIRKHRRISYLELERHTGITFARMKQLEAGDAAITVDELEALLGFYQLTFDQVRKFKRWNKLVIPALATLVVGVLLFCAFYFFPDLGGIVQRFQKSGQETVEDAALEQPGDFPEDTGLIVDEKEAEPAETEEISPDEHATDPAAPPVEDSEETVVFRFWGNIPYHAERLPEATGHAHARVVDIVPIQYLDDTRPDWLQDVNRDQLILNAGTSEVWTPTTVEAYEALQADQYQMLGLGTLPDVYEPLIMEVNDLKIGFLSMAGLIRNAEEIALASRVGLARAYRTDEITDAVSQAKEQVDYLFVLVDWGRKDGRTPNNAQRIMGNAMIRAGADAVIGNRPQQAQDFIFIDDKPLFYALGHAVSDSEDEAYHLMVEAEFSSGLDRLSVNVGKLTDGIIRFDLTAEEQEQVQTIYADKFPLPEPMKIEW